MAEAVSLRQVVLDRLDGEDAPAGAIADYVRAALDGEAALDAMIAGERAPASAAATPDDTPGTVPTSMYLREIQVEGFRGIGPEATLELEPGPGLTLVVGRNGSGKSSFAEALELVLTGDSFRWSGRGSKIWQDGWRNVHHDTRSIGIELVAEGHPHPVRLRQKWSADDTKPSDSPVWLELSGHAPLQLPNDEWDAAAQSFRPFLSYAELRGLLEEGPSKVYDALASVLGLEDLVGVKAVLDDARKAIDGAVKAATADAKTLAYDLEDLDDERAPVVLAALKKRGGWDLDAIREVVEAGHAGVDHTGDLARAAELAAMPDLNRERILAAASELRNAAASVARHAGTDADKARRTAELLEQALDFHVHVPGTDCPVCGRADALDDAWRADTEAAVGELRAAAQAAIGARKGLADATRHARSLVVAPSPLIGSAADLPVDASAANAAWEAFAATPDDPIALADHLEATVGPFADEVATLREAASTWQESQQDVWRPVADELAEWLPAAERSLAAKPRSADLKAAADWVDALTEELREARFVPIREQARAHWERMRSQSNVSLDDLALSGRATRRRLDLVVGVDGVEGAGVGVMSQGEINTLALALFLPRATLDQSPFRFVVIDDPVQSMDPARIDGLALALADVAKTRQVVVFTHDDRLADAARRLDLGARVLQVQRRPGSTVEISESLDPVRRYLSEANFLLKVSMPPSASRTIVPTLCRLALEAAAIDAVRRRWLTQGRDHLEIEAVLDDLQTIDLLGIVALDRRPEDKAAAYAALEAKFGADASKVVNACNEGSHDGYGGDLEDLCVRAGKLAKKVQATT